MSGVWAYSEEDVESLADDDDDEEDKDKVIKTLLLFRFLKNMFYVWIR